MLRSALSAKVQNLRLKGMTKHTVWDRLVFSKAKNAMGMKNVRLMISGGAPLPTQTMEVRTIKIYFLIFPSFSYLLQIPIADLIASRRNTIFTTTLNFLFVVTISC
jgi:hypothetical protein